jgi:arsenite methyltransferase
MTSQDELADIRERVRARYAEAAVAVMAGEVPTCGGSSSRADEAGTGTGLYSGTEQGDVAGLAVTASLGCGNPVAVADLRDGETVLDLGSGGGLDVLLSARRVGPAGKAYGLDMTEEMLSVARTAARAAGVVNVEFLRGYIEAIPLPSQSVDVIISNCVINLSGDRPVVLAESFRVLRPGGRLGVSDVVAEDRLTVAERIERGRPVGCLAGALSFAEYRDALARVGFTGITVTPTHPVADGLHSAIVRAVHP